MSNQEHTGDIYEYDPVADTWELREPLPGSTRTYAMALSYTNDGAIVAGKSGAGVNIYDGFFYLPSLDIWTPIPVYPGESGWVGATMAIDGRSFGGLGFTIADQGTHNDWWELVKEDDNGFLEVTTNESGRLDFGPNPVRAGETINFDASTFAPSGIVSLSIISSTGAIAFQDRLNVLAPLRIPDLAEGVYTISMLGLNANRRTGRLAVMER